MIYIELLWSFIKIGFTSFGGASMVPLISSEMISHGWMSENDVANIVAIAEMTPGPLGINCATFAGMNVAGALGVIMATLGVLMPTLTLAVLAAAMLDKFKSSKLLGNALIGIRPVSLGLVAAVMISMGMTNYVSWQTAAIGAVSLLVLLKFKLSVPIVVLISAVLGLILVR